MAHKWDMWLIVAYHRQHGMPVSDISKLTGVGEQTIWRWIGSGEKWEKACRESQDRFMAGLAMNARASIAIAVSPDNDQVDPIRRGELALRILERMDERFAPARQRHEHDWRLRLIRQAEVLPPDELERLAERGSEEEILALLGPGAAD